MIMDAVEQLDSLDTMRVRRQLTLFVPGTAALVIEEVRERVDPVQFGLIAAHVTLCREDEFADIAVADLRHRLERAALSPLTLVFGAPMRFDGHGMLLPCLDGTAAFHQLRVALLGRSNVRAHAAHLTLAHPRNPCAPGNIDAAFAQLRSPLTITFPEVALIEQSGAQPWIVLNTLRL
jgi:2'-5' RNA ligase superfamily